MKTTLAPLFSLLLTLTSPCQDDVVAATAAAPATAPDTFVLEAGTHEVTDLIDRVAAFLDFNILYEGSEIGGAGKIRITRRTEVDAHGCWDLFSSLLYHKNLAILPLQTDKGFYQVVNMNGPRAREISSAAVFVPYQEVESYAKSMATPIQTTVPLRNINATIATNALRPFFAAIGGANSGLTFGNVGNNTSLLVQGYAHQVAAACRLLERVDIGEAEDGKVQVVVLEHALAQELAGRLTEVFNARIQQAQVQAQMSGMPAAPPLRVVPHPSLNALILAGGVAQMDEALRLIAVLDQSPANAPAATVVEQLQHRVEVLESRLAKLEKAVRAEKSGK
ncbi:MAG: hypothetical protein H6838_14460 [Planctomycetes bacterium]|nr:hypothetical protein [Planctomycetota bacterium]MCB9886693.1 hypothetical protein [Planctomycetota bacterium]